MLFDISNELIRFTASAIAVFLWGASVLTSVHLVGSRSAVLSIFTILISFIYFLLMIPVALWMIGIPATICGLGYLHRLVTRKPLMPLVEFRYNLVLDSFTYGEWRQYLYKHEDGEFTPCRIVFQLFDFCFLEPVGNKSVNQQRTDF